MDEQSLVKNSKGQLTVFLAVSLIIIISLLAFVVNVGLFVKAKINLQNAVDAAAYSGASVQARMLSQAGHLNWEMRNTYKEWMFKYYVLGQKALTKTNPASEKFEAKNKMDFTADPFWPIGHPKRRGDTEPLDKYNIPSICIHFGTDHNLCEIASIPGLPRFETVGLPSISDQHESFINALVSTKSKDCSRRTLVNFGTAMLWAYGTKEAVFAGQTEIAANRTGAFPEAIELAIRMRNLEMIINRPPVSNICMNAAEGCENTINALDGEYSEVPLNERPIKAFMSAYRNLGGSINSDLKTNFILREVPPTPFTAPADSLSGYLIPERTIGQTGVSAREKHYVDLQILPVNLVNFFTFFSPTSSTFTFSGGSSVSSEGECTSTKTAIPVPAYPLGFVKNPKVLTYYAVEGESKFVGLFFPFLEQSGIKMKAYSAAKPFGGRIGPRIFAPFENNQLKPRDRSTPYISALDFTFDISAPGQSDDPVGKPIPFDDGFWINIKLASETTIGGIPSSGVRPRFGIPNLLYDYDEITDLQDASSKGSFEDVQEIKARRDERAAIAESAGLYDKKQFRLFAGNLPPSNGNVLEGASVEQALNNVRRPTRYEALNYLIPTRITPGDGLDTLGLAGQSDDQPVYTIYAPLFGPNTLHDNISTITAVVNDYIDLNTESINSFMNALRDVSKRIKDITTKGDTAGVGSYEDAANLIYNESTHPGLPDCSTASLAAMYNQLFLGAGPACGITPLRDKLTEYYEREAATPGYQNFYIRSYSSSPRASAASLMTAYMPGPRTGGGENGQNTHPFPDLIGNSQELSRRNFYSTKFVSIRKLSATENAGGNAMGPYQDASTYQELGPNFGNDVDGVPAEPYENPLDLSSIEQEFGTLHH